MWSIPGQSCWSFLEEKGKQHIRFTFTVCHRWCWCLFNWVLIFATTAYHWQRSMPYRQFYTNKFHSAQVFFVVRGVFCGAKTNYYFLHNSGTKKMPRIDGTCRVFCLITSHVSIVLSRYVESLKPRPPSKQIGQYESNKPIKSQLTYRQSINQLKGLQWKFTLDWLILHISGKMAPGV